MSSIVERGGIGGEAYTTARAWVGQIRGGLAMATVAHVHCLPQPAAQAWLARRAGQNILSGNEEGGLQCSSRRWMHSCWSTLGILIPPSIPFCVFWNTDGSVNR